MKEVNLLNLPGRKTQTIVDVRTNAMPKNEKKFRPTINYKKQADSQSLRFLDGGL